jgi:hypothetical protein
MTMDETETQTVDLSGLRHTHENLTGGGFGATPYLSGWGTNFGDIPPMQCDGGPDGDSGR